MAGVNVKSEIAPLKRVLLHRPGEELLNLIPDNLEELLFDDIPYLEVAQKEHDNFASTLRAEGVEVVYLEDLMAETLDANPSLREEFLLQWISEADIGDEKSVAKIYEWIDSHYPNNSELVLKTMAGITAREMHLNNLKKTTLVAKMGIDAVTVIPPMPNLYFTRDPFATIGSGVSVNHMYSSTRNRETIYGSYIFNHHPDYKSVENYYDRGSAYHIEGGDILNLNETTLAIGISQRTEAGAIDKLATNLFSSKDSKIDTILAFRIAQSRAFMHLDTVFTQVDADKFTVHPAILGPLTVYEIKKVENGEMTVRECTDTIENILSKYCGYTVELISCGGDDPIAASREQWNDGSNTLCLRPGTVVVYDRNNVTNEILSGYGLNVIEIASSELSRGRGGPRCMSMPLWRE